MVHIASHYQDSLANELFSLANELFSGFYDIRNLGTNEQHQVSEICLMKCDWNKAR